MTCEVCGNVGHSGDNRPETQEEALFHNSNNIVFCPHGGQGLNQPRPYYHGGNGNSNSFSSNQPTLRDLVYGQAKINESLQKKLAVIDKSMETIQAKMEGFSTTMKNQLCFNKMLETQLAQLAAAELGKISGQPESTLESVNVINAMWKEPLSRTPLNYAEKLTHPKRGAWGKLVAIIREDPGTPVISFSIFDCEFDHALCDLGASVNIMPKVTFKKLGYP